MNFEISSIFILMTRPFSVHNISDCRTWCGCQMCTLASTERSYHLWQ